jgi:hypothetical protein
MSHLSPVSRSSEGGHQGQTGHHHPHGLPFTKAGRRQGRTRRWQGLRLGPGPDPAGLIQTSLVPPSSSFVTVACGGIARPPAFFNLGPAASAGGLSALGAPV